ncbi:MAG: hypothetical protein JXP72_03370 [Coriobacteriia bacterium]|nr:hypothetical protein [Coriobacteriia bacterium]
MDRSRGRLRSVDSGCVGGDMELRKPQVVEADAVNDAEGNSAQVESQGVSPGS